MSSHVMRLDILAMRQHLFHLYQEMFLPVLDTYHLTQMEVDILLFLANNPQYDTASEIVSVRRLTKSHVSTSIEQLVQKGFLVRCYGDLNRRKIHLKLQPAARPVIEAGRLCQKKFAAVLSEGIPEQELAAASAVLGRMIENIKRYKGEI